MGRSGRCHVRGGVNSDLGEGPLGAPDALARAASAYYTPSVYSAVAQTDSGGLKLGTPAGRGC